MKLTIGFYTEGLPFDGETMYRSALGGSETALASMAAELARLGHRVKVFCRCDRPGTYAGVEYIDLGTFPETGRLFDFDVWVVSRFAHALNLPVRAHLRVLWNHDVITPEARKGILGNLAFCDLALFLSEFHQKQWSGLLPEIAPLAARTVNGVDLDYIDAATRRTEREKNVFLYASRPERGLDVLLARIWPRVLESLPDAELRIAGYGLEGLEVPREVRALEEKLARLVGATPNVKTLGKLNKKQLYREMKRATAVLYPTAFPEISCITALEAQACGTPILTTADFALTETVASKECLIAGNNRTKEYQEAYIERLFEILGDSKLYEKIAARGRAHVERSYRWRDVARSWEELFIHYMEGRSHRRRAAVVKELVRVGDLVTAREAAGHWDLRRLGEQIDKRLAAVESPETEDPLFDANPEWAKNDPRCALACRIVKDALAGWDSRKAPPRLLDVGSNNGAFAVHLSNELPEIDVVGIDYNPRALAFAERHKARQARRPDGISFRTAILDDLILAGEQFDLLFAGEVLEHVADTSDFLAKLRAVVRPGGIVILTFPYGSQQVLWDGDADAKDPRKRKVRHGAHVHHFDYGDVIDIFGGQRDLRIWRPTAEPGGDGAPSGNTVASFRVSSAPFGKVDRRRKRTVTRPYESLAVSMITKDAEDDLSRCLKSVLGVADDIHIHDTLSEDATLNVAGRFTDSVTRGAFTDFSAARNASIAAARCDWILWIDADEVLLFAENLRKYLGTRLMNGFAIRQNHLMIDIHGTFDQPIRVFRSSRGYRFTGLVHEHCEDVEKGPFDNTIAPALLLPDVDIAHTGYLCEAIRRQKCIRNFPLILEDARRNPDRQLTYVLLARDFLNFTNWEVERFGKLTDRAVAWLREAVQIHREHFADAAHKYHAISLANYLKALEHLGRAGVGAAADSPRPPFQVELGLAGAYGGLSAEGLRGERRWFADPDELMDYLAGKSLDLVERISG